MMKIDLILIGNSGAGKTSLIKRYINGVKKQTNSENEPVFLHTYTPTLGINLEKKVVEIQGKQINLQIWDTAGQERFFCLTKQYFQRADGIIICYDITDKDSFEKIESYWLGQIQDKTDNQVKTILVGNKVDLYQERQIKFVDGHALAQKFKIPYFETSAKTGEFIEEAFTKITKMCYQQIKKDKYNEEEINVIEDTYILQNAKQKPKNCFDKLLSFMSPLMTKMFNATASNDLTKQKKKDKDKEKEIFKQQQQ